VSYDFDSRLTACSHRIDLERYVVDTVDFRTLHLADNPTLNMRAPVNGVATVQLRISGELVQPGDPNYGYALLPDENRLLTPDRFLKIMFNKQVRWFVPLIEASYVTLQPYCLRCASQGQCNDFQVAQTGSFQRIVDTDKLVQKVLKFILTSRHAFYPQYTCKLRSYVGHKFGVSVTEADVASQITDSLQNIKQIQSAQRTVQSLSALEMLKDITAITTNMPDPTSMTVQCSVVSYGTQATPQTVTFSVASTKKLVGNN
jgi:hypothetical protein